MYKRQAQIEALRAEGRLFAPDSFADLAGKLKETSAGVVKALCLHIAHTCNLNCAYCFASQGKYHGERALMSFDVGKQALDFLVAHSGNRRNLEVDFFGGEPLMNFQVVKDLVAVSYTHLDVYKRQIPGGKGLPGLILPEQLHNDHKASDRRCVCPVACLVCRRRARLDWQRNLISGRGRRRGKGRDINQEKAMEMAFPGYPFAPAAGGAFYDEMGTAM